MSINIWKSDFKKRFLKNFKSKKCLNDTDIIKKPNKLDEIKNIGKRFILLTEFIFSNTVIVHPKFLFKNSFFNIIL